MAIAIGVKGAAMTARDHRPGSDAGTASSGLGVSSWDMDSSETLCEEPLVTTEYYPLGAELTLEPGAPRPGVEVRQRLKKACVFWRNLRGGSEFG